MIHYVNNLPPTTQQRACTRKDMLKDQAKNFAIDVGTDLIFLIWREYGKPLIQTKLHLLGQKTVAHLETPTKASKTSTQDDIKYSNTIGVEFDNNSITDDIDDNDKTIRFPNSRVS